MPTIAWLLLALHSCSLPETRKLVDDKGPMAALALSLSAFFRTFNCPESLHGVLRFDGEVEDGETLSGDFRPSPTRKDSPWAELVVLDPTQGSEELNLAPSLSPATQLLFVYELQRAAGYLQGKPDQEATSKPPLGKSWKQVEALFELLPPHKHALPALATESLAALLLQGDPSKGVGTIEVAIIERIVPRQGWSAPFLHRSDTTSELHARVCDVNEGSGGCQPRREGLVVLCPCHFVCILDLESDGGKYKLGDDDLERYRSMQRILSRLHTHQRVLNDVQSPNAKFNDVQSPQRERQVAATKRRRGRNGRKA